MPDGGTLPLASMAHIEHVLLLFICRTENMTEAHMWTALDSSGNGNHLPLVTPPQPAPVTIHQVLSVQIFALCMCVWGEEGGEIGMWARIVQSRNCQVCGAYVYATTCSLQHSCTSTCGPTSDLSLPARAAEACCMMQAACVTCCRAQIVLHSLVPSVCM